MMLVYVTGHACEDSGFSLEQDGVFLLYTGTQGLGIT